jgi:hypothetical protein
MDMLPGQPPHLAYRHYYKNVSNNVHLVTRFYSGYLLMSPNRPLLWLLVATDSGDITSSPVAIVMIW